MKKKDFCWLSWLSAWATFGAVNAWVMWFRGKQMLLSLSPDPALVVGSQLRCNLGSISACWSGKVFTIKGNISSVHKLKQILCFPLENYKILFEVASNFYCNQKGHSNCLLESSQAQPPFFYNFRFCHYRLTFDWSFFHNVGTLSWKCFNRPVLITDRLPIYKHIFGQQFLLMILWRWLLWLLTSQDNTDIPSEYFMC